MEKIHSIRYMFEHRLLPQYFFEDKAQFISILLHDKNILYRIIDELFQREQVENPYTEEQFDIDKSKVTEEVMMLKIIFPDPENEPLCYCSYLFFDRMFEKISYFCIEKGNSIGEDQPYVCSWTKEGVHRNHNTCTFEEYDDFLKCAEVHMSEFYGVVD